MALVLRPAQWRDVWRLYRWRNDPTTYQHCRQNAPVTFPTHLVWLWRTLRSPDVRLYIAKVEGQPVGTGRVDHVGADRELSITIDRRYRRRGYGTALIAALVEIAGGPVRANIHLANTASLAVFAQAGFLSGVTQGVWFQCRHHARRTDLPRAS